MSRSAHTTLWIAVVIVAILAVVLAARTWCLGSYLVATNSMENALFLNERILVNKLPTTNNPGRNRVVLFSSPLNRDSMNPPLILSRCIGMPGDTIVVKNECYNINGRNIPHPKRSLNAYFIANSISAVVFDAMKELSIPTRDLESGNFGYTLTLTAGEETRIRKSLPGIAGSLFHTRRITPYRVIVPKRGHAYRLDDNMLTVCSNAIMKETNGEAVIKNGTLYLKGKETNFFFFHEDYYWMLSDNINEAVDSRKLGFVPASSIIGNAFLVWYSKDRERLFRRVE